MAGLIILLLLSALAAVAIIGTAIALIRDGYRRVPLARPQREYERDENYRARP